MTDLSLITLQDTHKFRTDKGSRHFYLDIYDELFKPYKHLSGYLLEIGVEWGGSLSLWDSYFEKMIIVGCDIARYLEHMPESDRIKYILGDAYTTDTITQISTQYPKFNIIIDDGPHSVISQITTVTGYSPLIDVGLLIIEDVNRGELPHLLTSIHAELTQSKRNYSLTTIDKNSSRRMSEHQDDTLVIIEFV